MKPLKHSVAIVVRGEPSGPEPRVLAVRRPPDDEELPGIWGLPAATLREGESWEAAVGRAGFEKLGVTLEPVGELGEGTQERPAYKLHMKLYEARIAEGEPEVPQAVRGVTQYAAWEWAAPSELVEGARRGSVCCRLYLWELGENRALE
jgi:ADP-ribose pyrophosphatase YjhB (NUDIX family)